MLTQERLKAVAKYNPETGEFIRLQKTTSWVKLGEPMGCLHHSGYRYICIDRKVVGAQRLAFLYMTGRWPKNCVDHINGDRADNRWCNLREATNTQNTHNAKRRADNKSGFKGVRLHYSGKWEARVAQKHYGLFATPEEAHAARCKAIAELHGEFARSG
jgi:hypothetical protein